MLLMLMIRPSTKSFTVHSNMEDIAREAGSINLEEDTLFSMYHSNYPCRYSWSCSPRVLY